MPGMERSRNCYKTSGFDPVVIRHDIHLPVPIRVMSLFKSTKAAVPMLIRVKSGLSRRSGGFAIVLVLSMLVLMLVVSLALFSRAQVNRQISASSSANRQVDLLADAAMEIIAGDLAHEVKAGSEPDADDPGPDGLTVLQPRLVESDLLLTGSSVPVSVAPSMQVERRVTAENAPATLVKQSLRNTPFFTEGAARTNLPSLPPIPDRAAAVNTADESANRRSLPAEAWGMTAMARSGETVPAPDWIYLNRGGQTPQEFTSAWADRTAGNESFVIGRFAYNIYDVGGLIDINLVGNALPSAENLHRGRLHQVSLQNATGGLAMPDFPDFVTWRSGKETAATLFDPVRDFSKVPAGGQAFVSRQDLLDYTANDDSPVPATALPLLTVHSRALDAPIFSHDPELMDVQPAEFQADEINASLVGTRFPVRSTLERGTGAAVTVPAGSPLMARRFPLSKIALLADDAADASDLAYYFGFEKQPDGSFRYTATSDDGRIKRPEEIAAEGREPNFFEILQAVLPAGSLGQSTGNSYTIDHPRDILRNLQVMQIGANIIDQWDGDDFPTAIGYPSGNPGEWLMHYGVENLPYINSFEFVAHHPEWSDHRLQVWMLFSVWNPHQSAVEAADGIAEFRIQPVGGEFNTFQHYQIRVPTPLSGTASNRVIYLGGSGVGGQAAQAIADLNAGRELTFANDGSYSDARVIRADAPDAEPDQPGLLVSHVSTDSADAAAANIPYYPPIVPADLTQVQVSVRNGVAGSPGINEILQYLLTQRHAADGLPPPTQAELDAARIPPDGTGFFGAKAFNLFRLRGVRNNRPEIHLQYRPDGSTEWKSYQVISDLIPHLSELDGSPPDPNTRGFSAGSSTRLDGINSATELEEEANRVRLKSAPGWVGKKINGESHSFFDWRGASTMIGAMKYDPRTIRFGHPGHYSFLLGAPDGLPSAAGAQPRTIQSTVAVPDWSAAYTSAYDMSRRTPWWVSNDLLRVGLGNKISGLTPNPYPNIEWANVARVGWSSAELSTPVGFIRNIPEGSVDTTTNLSRYRDWDGIVRPADGYLGRSPALPLAGDGEVEDRPLILNRPFRSIGELGFVFRDLPWKSLDLFSRNSADLGLVDVFSIEEAAGEKPLVTGKVNLNSAPAGVLSALLQGTAKTEDGAATISAAEANGIAAAIVAEREARGAFLDAGDLVRRVLAPASASTPGTVLGDLRKGEREAAIRTLSSLGTTRTWNFLLDLVVQSGRMRVGANSADQFVVQAEKRFWVHLAVDRLTGEIVAQQWEVFGE